jgi:hypothetical protein
MVPFLVACFPVHCVLCCKHSSYPVTAYCCADFQMFFCNLRVFRSGELQRGPALTELLGRRQVVVQFGTSTWTANAQPSASMFTRHEACHSINKWRRWVLHQRQRDCARRCVIICLRAQFSRARPVWLSPMAHVLYGACTMPDVAYSHEYVLFCHEYGVCPCVRLLCWS